MIEQGEHVGPGAVIEYVVCIDQSKSSVADRAYHPKTVLKAEGMLQVGTACYTSPSASPAHPGGHRVLHLTLALTPNR
jgi:hypothetical protein